MSARRKVRKKMRMYLLLLLLSKPFLMPDSKTAGKVEKEKGAGREWEEIITASRCFFLLMKCRDDRGKKPTKHRIDGSLACMLIPAF